jgi:hypothetical protein
MCLYPYFIYSSLMNLSASARLNLPDIGFGGKEEMSATAGALTGASGAVNVALGISTAVAATGFIVALAISI